jgi:hypothetical protein
MALERCPKERKSSGANQRALRKDSLVFLDIGGFFIDGKAYINTGNRRKGLSALVFYKSFNYPIKNIIKRIDRRPHQSKRVETK